MKTTDLCDEHGDKVMVADPIGFRHFGGRTTFSGLIETVKCFEDNSLVRATLEQNGRGKVLVVDGGGSLRVALIGDNLAALARHNEWAGILVHGAIRDAADVATIEIGVVALATNPRKSAKNNEGDVGVLVHFAGINFEPGHTVYVDADGIITSETPLAVS